MTTNEDIPEAALLPTRFRGICWDENWEFDAPCILFAPFCRYEPGGNAHHLVSMVEDICINLSLGETMRRGWSDDNLYEFKWRGWSTRFARRKDAWHLTIAVRWKMGRDGLEFEIVGTKETWGPHK